MSLTDDQKIEQAILLMGDPYFQLLCNRLIGLQQTILNTERQIARYPEHAEELKIKLRHVKDHFFGCQKQARRFLDDAGLEPEDVRGIYIDHENIPD